MCSVGQKAHFRFNGKKSDIRDHNPLYLHSQAIAGFSAAGLPSCR